ncbi:MAG: (2Fe-2S) ferredoxin domain-containing protein [Anaerolineae bacterium]|nr:(2Fe-2S) ferredoxin domain-containing protein [Anaerolineae bacterium]
MPVVKSIEELKRLREEALTKRQLQATGGRAQITVYMGTCGIAAGARDTMKAILDTIEAENVRDVIVKQTGCIGLCEQEPLVEVQLADTPPVRYGHVSAERAARIVKEHVIGGKIVDELVVPE